MLITRPLRCFVMARTIAWVKLNAPRRFVPITASQSSGHPHDECVAPYSSVVHQDVGPAKVFENLATDFLDGSMVRDIDRVSFRRIGAHGVDFIRDLLRVLLRSAHASHPRAFLGEL